jgi:hypothetical protein
MLAGLFNKGIIGIKHTVAIPFGDTDDVPLIYPE